MTAPLRRVAGRATSWARGRVRPAPHRRIGPRFEVVGRFRPFEVVSPGFVAVADPGGSTDRLVRSTWSPPAPFVGVECDVPKQARAVVAVGLAAEDGERLVGFHDPATRRVGLEIVTGGTSTVLAAARAPRGVRRLGFVLAANEPTVLVDAGAGWRALATDRHRVAPRLDLRRPETLARFTATWGGLGRAVEVGPVRAGVFGMAGLRDLHVVQHADGTPYTDGEGRMFLTATCAGLGFFTQAHWGVFAFHPDRVLDEGLEQTAHLFTRRDGLVLGDHAGQLVRDGDRWHVAVSSWGDFTPDRGVHVRHLTTSDDLLHGVHLLGTERTAMPTERGSYDPGLTLVDGRWHVSYVESVSHRPSRFHPALAVAAEGAASWTAGLRRVGEADDLDFTEGPILARLGEGWRVLASDGRARRYPVFDLRMRRVGDLDAPYGTNLPHPNVVELPGGGRLLLTFDGTPHRPRVLGYGTHGDVVVMRADPA